MKANHLLFIALSSSLIACSTSKQLRLTDCKSLTLTDSSIVEVAGMIDHNDMDVAWLKNEIKRDSIRSWLTQYNTRNFADLGTIRDSVKLRRDLVIWIDSMSTTIRSHILDGDKLLYYSTPEDWWWSLAGQDGIIVVRKCKIVFQLILSQS